LSGTLPSSVVFWANLRSLRVLNVDDNRLSGSIPSEIAALGSGGLVSLELSDNRLSGASPLPPRRSTFRSPTLTPHLVTTPSTRADGA